MTTPKPQKPDVPAGALAVACTFNALFATLAAADYSVDLWVRAEPAQRLPMLGYYYQWRSWPPVIQPVLIMLLLLLPVVIFGFCNDALAALLGWKRATTLRHVADVLQAATLICALLPTVVTRVEPALDEIKESCTPAALKNSGAACLASLDAALPLHLTMLVLNVIMFSCDVAKFLGNNASKIADKKED